MKYRANTETRSIALQKYNFLHHGGKGHVSQQAPECVISPHTYYITVEMLAICSSKNVVACRTGLKKSCNLFSEEALRVPRFSILFNEEGNSFPKPLRDAAPAPAVAVPLPKGAVLKGTNRKISRTFPIALISAVFHWWEYKDLQYSYLGPPHLEEWEKHYKWVCRDVSWKR